jgi:SAM-dependent methyltransferase
VDELLSIARSSPLTDLIARALPAGGVVLEGGCGLGQYVVLLRGMGHRVFGADLEMDALCECRRRYRDAPLSAMDLRQLAIRSGVLSAYVSLGVVEHDPAGPDKVVSEAARALRVGGVLLLSVPYWNGARRLLAPYLVRRNRWIRAAGGQFHQFAFTRQEVSAFLGTHGFEVRSFRPYDPARVLRQVLRALSGKSAAARGERPSRRAEGSGARRGWLKRTLQRLLYTSPMPGLFGHMILAVAVKR